MNNLRSFVVLFSIVTGALAANAQTALHGTFQLTSEVRWGKAVLPVGEYTLTINSVQSPIVIQSMDGKASAMAAAESIADAAPGGSYIFISGSGNDRQVRSMNLPQMGRSLIFALQVPPKKVTQKFICNIGYSQEKCDQQMSILRKALTRYSISQPDNWTWVLVLSDRWKPILRERRMNSNTPAFTYLDKRQTFVEEAIVVSEGVVERRTELLKEWRVPLDQLLDLAVTHELAHAICHEPDEGKADRYGRMLREGKPLVCSSTAPPGTRVPLLF